MGILSLLEKTVELKASDLHITVGYPPVVRINGELKKIGEEDLTPSDNLALVKEILDEERFSKLEEIGELDFSMSERGLGRFRINIYKQRGTYGMAIRAVSLNVPSMDELGLPSVFGELAMKKRGLVLITGATGSGKSTTLAAMINKINEERNCHILTLEDPIEYLHKHKKSVVNQREIGSDSQSFSNALRAALRQDPDVILVGEMRDLETMYIALTAAETGHLVLSTLHTIGAANTVDRIIDVFPPHQRQQVIMQLSTVLQGVVSQQLLPRADGKGRELALEIMIANTAIRNLIREGKTHQIQTAIQTGGKYNMQTMDSSICQLYKDSAISLETAIAYSIDKEYVKRTIGIL